MVLAALLVGAAIHTVGAQAYFKDKLEVNTRMVESKGTYIQRQSCREFLRTYMKKCPFVSNFNIHESAGSLDNHDVVWAYQVGSWNDISKFYRWISAALRSRQDSGLRKALTPYNIQYSAGGFRGTTGHIKSMIVRN